MAIRCARLTMLVLMLITLSLAPLGGGRSRPQTPLIFPPNMVGRDQPTWAHGQIRTVCKRPIVAIPGLMS